MKNTLTKCSSGLLIAGLLALPMGLISTPVMAQRCSSGGCGIDRVETAMGLINRAERTVRNASPQDAYRQIESVAAGIDELNVGSVSKVRNSLGSLVRTLQVRTNEQFDSAVESYFEGYHSDALATFRELAALEGLPAANKAQRELDKEDDRVAWREAKELAAQRIGNKDYGQAREPVTEMQRLARRTGYTTQTNTAMNAFATQMLPDVEAGEKMIAQEQYDRAYAMLIEISRLTPARESATAARRAIGKSATLPGMRQAKGEYDGKQALTQTQEWYTEIAHPSPNEQKLYMEKLEAIAKSFSGTTAAEQAKQLLGSDTLQAAR